MLGGSPTPPKGLTEGLLHGSRVRLEVGLQNSLQQAVRPDFLKTLGQFVHDSAAESFAIRRHELHAGVFQFLRDTLRRSQHPLVLAAAGLDSSLPDRSLMLGAQALQQGSVDHQHEHAQQVLGFHEVFLHFMETAGVDGLDEFSCPSTTPWSSAR